MKENFLLSVNKLRKILFITVFALGLTGVSYAQYLYPSYQTYSIMEPSDLVFYIEWGSDSEISSVIYYYYDEFDVYHEAILTASTDYEVNGVELIMYQSYFEGFPVSAGDDLNFYAEFGSSSTSGFYVNVVYTSIPSLFNNPKNYDLSNPDDVFSIIAWADYGYISSVSVDGNTLNSSDYYVEGDWVFFTNEYLSTVLLSPGNSITADVEFDSDVTVNFTINAIQTGLNNAELSQEEFVISTIDSPEYIETIITWNSASSVESLYVTFVESDYPQEMEYTDYTVTPINASTATLRIYLDNGSKNDSKATISFYATIQVNYNAGGPSYMFLTMLYEFYYVDVNSIPWEGGWTEGGGYFGVGENVTVEAFPYTDFTFLKWIIDGETEITENPYNFTLPDHDVDIEAVFMSPYPMVFYANPATYQNNVDPNTLITLTFNKNIAEGTSANGFDDITMTDNLANPWTITDVYISEGNKLVIVPQTPMNINTSYNIDIPAQSVEDAATPGVYMNGNYWTMFTTGWGDYQHGEIDPEWEIYSMMEPANVDFNIVWGDDENIDNIYYYYYDLFSNYYEVELTNPADFTISGNTLTINNSFISNQFPSPENPLNFFASFESGYVEYFGIEVIVSGVPTLTPTTVYYDLSNPDDVFTNIIYNQAESITSLSRNMTPLVEGTDYTIVGTWLFINNSYLDPLLNTVPDGIVIDVTFNTADVTTLTVLAVQTGINNATINPNSGSFEEDNMPAFIETVITWNDASSVTSLTIWFEEDGEMFSMDYPYYTVTPINASTALLSISTDEGDKGLKTTEMFNSLIEVSFNIGASAYYFMTFIDEYYTVHITAEPEFAGSYSGDWNYSVGEEVSLQAFENMGYDFQNWRIDGISVSTDNPYIFNMPANDIYITAYFVSEGTTLYTLTLNSLPIAGGSLTGAGEFEAGENVTINAVPNSGYAFVNWTDELSAVFATSGEYTFSMPANDLTLNANFIDNSSVESNNFINQSVYPNPFFDRIIISEPENVKSVSFTSVTGQLIDIIYNPETGHINTSDLPKGFYMIIIENENGERLVKKMLKQ